MMVRQQFRVVIIRRSSSSRSSVSGGANFLHFNNNYHRHSRNNSSILRIDKSIQQLLGHQEHCSFSSSSNGSSSFEQQQQQQRPRMAWLDLRGTFLSALERLVIDELLLRHDPITDRCWGIVGVHEPTTNRILQISSSSSLQSPQITQQSVEKENDSDDSDPTTIIHELEDDVYGHDKQTHHNDTCCIILGIGGKAERLINIPAAKKDGILTLRRFTGGGTVVVDHTSLLTTLIIKDDAHVRPAIKPYPREIMEWTNEYVFGPAFTSWNNEIVAATAAIANSNNNNREKQTLIFHGKSCGLSGGDGGHSQQQQTLLTTSTPSIIMPTFRLRENDYVLNDRKVGGNAQSIVSGGFLHHTSFLWDWDENNMEYLTLPSKRPEYRGDRNHDEFLVRLKETYGKGSTKHSLFLHMKNALANNFQLEEVTLQDILEIANIKFGGLQQWFDGKCRTKIVEL